MWPMRYFLLMIAAVVLVGCGTTSKETPTTTSWVSDPSDRNNVEIEGKIRYRLKKPEGELTTADLGNVTRLILSRNQLTDVKGLEEQRTFKKIK